MHTGNVWTAWALAVHERLAEAAAQTGLDLRGCAALTLVGTHEGCSVDWLHRRIGLTQSGTVRLVDRLAGLGLLTRAPRAGRVTSLALTPRGRARMRQWLHARDQAIAGLRGDVGEADLARATAVLARALAGAPRTRREADATCRACDWPACGPDCPVDRSVQADD